jgi:hypothetical protein
MLRRIEEEYWKASREKFDTPWTMARTGEHELHNVIGVDRDTGTRSRGARFKE